MRVLHRFQPIGKDIAKKSRFRIILRIDFNERSNYRKNAKLKLLIVNNDMHFQFRTDLGIVFRLTVQKARSHGRRLHQIEPGIMRNKASAYAAYFYLLVASKGIDEKYC
jgi:hypothetical protein